MVRIVCEDLRKVFTVGSKQIVAVDGVDLTIEDGTFATLLGPSGCGKTTLLRMLGGLETATSGSILFDDEDMTNVSVQDRRISMVFQSIALFPFKTVRDNIEYGLKYTSATKTERAEKAEEFAELVGIGELMDNKPNQLSGGQRQRVALARALIRDPNLFLLDEPMSDLDAELKVDLRTEIKELHNEFQTTTLYVTHDQEEAMTLSEEVIVMSDGKVQQKSPPFELFAEPDNMFVARFIGSPNINFFPATLDDESLRVPGFERPIEVSADAARTIRHGLTGDDIRLGIRPSSLELAETPGERYFQTKARIYEQLGDETILHSTFVGDGDGDDQDVRAMVPPHVTPEEGETMDFRFEARDVHVFDGETGETVMNGLTEGTPMVEPAEKGHS